MPHLTIYVPDDLALALKRRAGEMNISRVCADALRAKLDARGVGLLVDGMFTAVFTDPQPHEEALMRRYRLRRAVARPAHDLNATESVAVWACTYLNEILFEGLRVGIGGGNQMWQIVRRLEPRNLGLDIWALGFGDIDREVPHVHPNALVTLLGMQYGTRTTPTLVGAHDFKKYWVYPATYPPRKELRQLIVGSCAMFDADSPWARQLGNPITNYLVEEHVLGDFLGVFITPDGRILEPYPPLMTQSHIPAADLQQFAKREDTLVLLTAAGGHKVKLIRKILELGLCNAIVTDDATARAL